MKTAMLLAATLVLVFPLSGAAAAGIDSALDARQAVLDELLAGNVEGKRLLVHPDLFAAGTVVENWRGAVLVTPSEGYVVFIDDAAFANFEHPCRFVFVDRATGKHHAASSTTPGKDMGRWLELKTPALERLMSAGNVRAPRVAPRAAPARSSRGGDVYAVLMSGGADQWNNHVRYWNDLQNIYVTLVDVYGYPDDHIIVLCSDGTNPAVDQSNGMNSDPDLDGDGDADIMYSCVLSNIQAVFNQLAGILSTNDQLFVFTTDHGGSNSGWSTYLNLWNFETLTDAQFAGMLSNLPQCDMIFTMEQCFSGGFEDDISTVDGRVFSSACSYNEYSWAMPPDYVYDTYVFFWTAAVKWQDAYGVPCDADTNNDEVVDMYEAFLYAEAEDFSDEAPQYNSTPADLGSQLNLGVEVILDISFPEGLPEEREPPGPAHPVTVLIEAGEEQYVPGSGFLHYRFDPDDPYTAVPLTPLSGGLFEAAIPGARPGDQPEYYFSAQGDLGSMVYSPSNAPLGVYSFTVCLVRTFFEDDFETDQGWSVSNIGLQGGAWERGVPAGNGDYGDPTEDGDGSGSCYVTGNGAAIDDVDGGPTRLVSPAMNLSAGGAVVSFDLWYFNDDGDDPFKIFVSNNNGANYVAVDTLYGGAGGWSRYSFNVADYVSPTDRVKVKLSVKDLPDNSLTEAAVDGVRVEQHNFNPTLWADAYSFSAPAGCDIAIMLDAGPGHGGRPYIVAGSLHGTEPGTVLPGGQVLPLNRDWFTEWILDHAGSPFIPGFHGNLDSGGEAVARFVLPGPQAVPAIGKTMALAFTLTDGFDFVSNAVLVAIEP